MIFWASISIKELNIDNQNTLECERWNLIPIFPTWSNQFFVCFLIDHRQHNHFQYTFNCFVLYLAIIVLDNSLLLVGSISVVRDNYYFRQSGARAIKSHQIFSTFVGEYVWVVEYNFLNIVNILTIFFMWINIYIFLIWIFL